MPGKKVDGPGVVLAIRIVDGEASNPKDQKRAKSEVPPTRPISSTPHVRSSTSLVRFRHSAEN
jgi:hypothetical protein